jgi:hypothetical protein
MIVALNTNPRTAVQAMQGQEKGRSNDHHDTDSLYCSRPHGGRIRCTTVMHSS